MLISYCIPQTDFTPFFEAKLLLLWCFVTPWRTFCYHALIFNKNGIFIFLWVCSLDSAKEQLSLEENLLKCLWFWVETPTLSPMSILLKITLFCFIEPFCLIILNMYKNCSLITAASCDVVYQDLNLFWRSYLMHIFLKNIRFIAFWNTVFC